MQHPATRRMYRRVMVEYSGCYLTCNSLRPSLVRDMSLNGFRIANPSGLRCNSLVMVRLWLPGQEIALDIDQAVVRWVHEYEFGVQIVAITNEADIRLAIHIEQILDRKAVA